MDAEFTPPRKHDRCFHPGEYLADELQARVWCAIDLAERTGLSPQEIRDYVNNEGYWTMDKWERVARAFGTSVQNWMSLQMTWKKAVNKGVKP